jgi:ATP-dependent helicase/nuclease subunit B
VSEVRIISPQRDLIETVVEYLRPSGKDYSNSVVVFPGKRPGYFLRKALARRERTSIIPPRLFAIDRFSEFLLSEHLHIDRKIVDTVDAIAILHGVHQKLNATLGGSAYASLDAFLPLALKLFSELEEVALADIPPRRLREVIQGFNYPKFFALSDYYEQFYNEIEQRGYLTRSTSYRTVAENLNALDLSRYNTILLAGFYAFTSVERRIVAHLHKLENVVLLFQNGPGLRKQLQSLGIEPDDSAFFDPATAESEPEIHFCRAPDSHGQVLALAATLHEKIHSGWVPDERSVIVLPSSEALFPVLHAPLSLLDENQFNISLGYPLPRTPVFGFLNNLMELVAGSVDGRYSAQRYLRFVLHPYTKNVRFGSRSDITRILFHRIEEFLASRKAKVLLSLDELEEDEALYEFVSKAFEGIVDPPTKEELKRHVQAIHDKTIRRFLTFASLGDFAEKAIDVLTYVFDFSTASRHPYFRPYAQQFINILDGIRSSLLQKDRFDSVLGYFTFFRQYVATESVPFTGTPVQGLQVLGLLETRNLKFDTLYMLDVNDDVIPSKPAEDLLLPQLVRQALKLQTNREREQLSEYYFTLAIAAASEVHLFYTETESGKREKSRFVQKLLWERERFAGRALESELEQTVKYRVSLVNEKPPAISKTLAIVSYLHTRNRFSATQLDTYLACPLKFYYRTVLGLREKGEASEDLDQRDIGSLVHRILKEYFSSFVGRALRISDVKASDLDATIDRCFTEEYGKDPLGPPVFLRQQIHLQLHKFLEHYQIPLLQSGEIAITDLEREFTIEKNGIRFTGSIDRIEKRNGNPFILDYKTGSNATSVKIRTAKIDLHDRKSWSEAIGSFQLPLYMLLYSEEEKAPLETITPAYLFLGKNEITMDVESSVGGDDVSPAETYAAVEPVMFELIAEILDEGKPFHPTIEPEKQCHQCPYTAICGTSWATVHHR